MSKPIPETCERPKRLLFGRDPDKDELSSAITVAKDRGLEIVCRALINSNEFAFLP